MQMGKNNNDNNNHNNKTKQARAEIDKFSQLVVEQI